MKKYIFVGAAIVIVSVVALKLTVWKSNSSSANDLIKVERIDLAQEVLVTGRVKTSRDLNLAFSRTGKIASVYVKVGDNVAAGDTLAALDQADVTAQYDAAKAALAAETAKWSNMKAGTRPEELAIQKSKVDSANAAVEDAIQNLNDKMNDAYNKADDAVRNKSDQMISNSRGSSPQLSFSTDGQLNTDILTLRVLIEPQFTEWAKMLNAMPTDSADIMVMSTLARGYLGTVNSFLDKLSLAVNQLTTTSSISATTLSGWKTDLATARANVQTALSNISTASATLRVDISNSKIEQQTLVLDQAGSTADELTAEENLVKQLRAKLEQLDSTLSDTMLRAPVSGLISTVEAKVGEIAMSNTPLIRIVSLNTSEIETSIPETDIGSVALGNPVIITLDAFPGEVFRGKVVLIDPAETVVDGVVSFKTTIRLENVNPRVKSGMTANLRIRTISKKGVLVLPQYAVIENDHGKFVMLSTGDKGKFVETEIKTGIRNPEGLVEIMNGVKEGDIVQNVGIK